MPSSSDTIRHMMKNFPEYDVKNTPFLWMFGSLSPAIPEWCLTKPNGLDVLWHALSRGEVYFSQSVIVVEKFSFYGQFWIKNVPK